MDRIWTRFRDLAGSLFRLNGDDHSRSVAIVLTVLGTLAVLSFVMAGVVGAWEKSEAPAASAYHSVIPSKGA
jgi:hypothetical protein